MLDVVQLMELEERLRPELDSRLEEIVSRLNRTERLEEFLEMVGLKNLLSDDSAYEIFKKGTIVVIGASKVKKVAFIAIGEELGICRDRFEFYLEYKDIAKLKITDFKRKLKYSLIMVGPMPHSGAGKEDASSIISAMESKEGYPPVVRLGTNGLKISKSDFRNKLQESIDTGKILA